jgi:hypothetical protein
LGINTNGNGNSGSDTISPDTTHQSFEVFTLGETQQHRMIGRLRVTLDHLHIALGINGRPKDDFLE